MFCHSVRYGGQAEAICGVVRTTARLAVRKSDRLSMRMVGVLGLEYGSQRLAGGARGSDGSGGSAVPREPRATCIERTTCRGRRDRRFPVRTPAHDPPCRTGPGVVR